MKAYVNAETCIGCEVCVTTCPGVFQMNDDNIAEVIVNIVPEADQDNCREASDSCPVEAITIEDD